MSLNLIRLPVDVIAYIFKMLPYEDVQGMFHACKLFYRIQDNDMFWRILAPDMDRSRKDLSGRQLFALHTSKNIFDTRYMDVMIRYNDLVSIRAIIEFCNHGKWVTKQLLSSIIADDNFYLFTWYLKTQKKKHNYLLRQCARDNAVSLMEWLLNHWPVWQPIKTFSLCLAIERMAMHKNISMVDRLLKLGNSFEYGIYIGNAITTMIADSKDQEVMISWFLKKTQEMNIQFDYETYLERACRRNSLGGLRALAPYCSSNQLRNYLEVAIDCGHRDMVKTFLKDHEDIRRLLTSTL